LFVAGTAVIVSFAIGTLLGVAAAWWRRGALDTWLPSDARCSSVRSRTSGWRWLGLYLLGFRLRWFPLGHAYPDDATPEWTWGSRSTCCGMQRCRSRPWFWRRSVAGCCRCATQ
jgi:peptide/nickel transport system permease protein